MLQGLVQLIGFQVGVGQLAVGVVAHLLVAVGFPGGIGQHIDGFISHFLRLVGLAVQAVQVGQLIGKGIVFHRDAGLLVQLDGAGVVVAGGGHAAQAGQGVGVAGAGIQRHLVVAAGLSGVPFHLI